MRIIHYKYYITPILAKETLIIYPAVRWIGLKREAQQFPARELILARHGYIPNL